MNYILFICIWFMIIMDISSCVTIYKFKNRIQDIKDDVNTLVGNTYCDLQCNVDKLYKDLQKCKKEIKKLKNKVGD